MTNHIFFSWQSDTPNGVGRAFLRQVLEEACKELAADSEVDEAMRDIKVDSDTQGVAGQPPIADTILKKIDDAAVFVSDMTFVATRLNGRPSPNPNVLIEYGWALKSLSHSRVLSVMNTAFGEPTLENMPFDLAHSRWPTRYTLPEGASAEIKAAEKKKLKRAMKEAIQACLATIPLSMPATPPAFPAATAKDGPARFRAPNEALGYDEDSLTSPNREMFLAPGAAMWLRLMPLEDPGRRWKIGELKPVALENSNLFPLLMPAGGYSYVRASDGFGIYRAVASGELQTVQEIGFAFRTGEVWSIETALLGFKEDVLLYAEIENAYVRAAERYRRFLQKLGIDGPYGWRAGLTGVKGRYLNYPPRPGYGWVGRERGAVCAADEIEVTGVLGAEQGTLEALVPLFERIFEECGLDRPNYLGGK